MPSVRGSFLSKFYFCKLRRKMKGILITVIGLIIGVIVLVILMPLLFKAASNVWSQLTETLGIVKYSQIERALICYYYLCKSGCSDPIFFDFCSPDKIGKDAYEEACSLASALGMDGKQCTEAPFQFPMKIKLEESAEVSKDRLKKKIDTPHLLITTERTSGEVDWFDVIARILIPVYRLIKLFSESAISIIAFHAYNLTNIEEESYSVAGVVFSHLVKFANLKSGSYYISGLKAGWPDRYYIFVDSYPRYISVSSNSLPSEIEVLPGTSLRISVEDEKGEDLNYYNYLLKVILICQPTYEYNEYVQLYFIGVNFPQQSCEVDWPNTPCTFSTRNGKIEVTPLSFSCFEKRVNITISYEAQYEEE